MKHEIGSPVIFRSDNDRLYPAIVTQDMEGEHTWITVFTPNGTWPKKASHSDKAEPGTFHYKTAAKAK